MGADLAHFNDMIVAVEEIHEKFALEFPQGALLRNEVQNFDGELVLNFGTRYLTPPRVAKGDIALKIDRSIDPFGILEKAGGTRGKHLADNKVTYLARTIVSDGAKARYVRQLILQAKHQAKTHSQVGNRPARSVPHWSNCSARSCLPSSADSQQECLSYGSLAAKHRLARLEAVHGKKHVNQYTRCHSHPNRIGNGSARRRDLLVYRSDTRDPPSMTRQTTVTPSFSRRSV